MYTVQSLTSQQVQTQLSSRTYRIDRCMNAHRCGLVDSPAAEPASTHVSPVQLLRCWWRAIGILLCLLLRPSLLCRRCLL